MVIKKTGGPNPCKTKPGEVRTVAYYPDYSSAEAAAFAYVSTATVYRAIREGHLPTDTSIAGHPRIQHADLVAWMEARGFPVPQPKRGPAPRHLAIPAPSSAAHQQRGQANGRLEPVVDIALEPADHLEVPGAALVASGWCLSYHPDDEGWLANTDEAIEEAEVSVSLTTVEMRALASVLFKMADELEAPVAAPPPAVPHAPLASPVEANSPQLLELAEAAQRFGIGRQFLQKEIRAGRLPAYRLGGRYRLSIADITAWLERQRVGAGTSGVQS